jgi:hypothetical protein
VIACLLCRKPEASILLGQSPYHDMWTPPQESFPQALRRCLEVECGLQLPEKEEDFARRFYLRSIRYVGTLELPKDRHGERPVADNALGTPLEHIVLRRVSPQKRVPKPSAS